ncbi:MAG: hypothetical protein ABIC57_01390 [bacterium]
MSDTINIEIMDDGQLKIKTEGISDAAHISADSLLSQMETLLGGHVTRIKNPEKHNHLHHQHTAKVF